MSVCVALDQLPYLQNIGMLGGRVILDGLYSGGRGFRVTGWATYANYI